MGIEYSIGKLGDDVGGLPGHISDISAWLFEHESKLSAYNTDHLAEINDLLQLIPKEYNNPKVCHYLARLLQELLMGMFVTLPISNDEITGDSAHNGGL